MFSLGEMEKSERAPDSEWCRNMTLEALKTTGF